jgi:ribosomal protein L24E
VLEPGVARWLVVSIIVSGTAVSVDTRPARASALRPASPLDCAGLRVITLPSGRITCTPGPDPAPEGVDPTTPRPLVAGTHSQGMLLPDPPGGAPTSGAAAGAGPGIRCYGDGQSGNRVQAVYAVPADRPDRYGQVLPSIRQWAAETDAVFQASASKTGGKRHVRFVTDANCDLDVMRVRLSSTGDDTFNNTLAEFEAQGLDRSDRKYLVWTDSTVFCGIANYWVDDRASPDNFNNGPPGTPATVSRIDSGCWGLGSRGQSVEAHELMHSLGSVLPTAPHASPAGHCNDDADRMCYQDGSVLVLLSLCAAEQESLFDCANDDYFSTAPAPGSYLGTHWNAANSSFLSSSEGDRLPAVVDPKAGYWFVAADGGIFSFGDARFFGSTGHLRLNQPIVGMAPTPTGAGYWFVAAEGGIFAMGDARFFGSTGNLRLNQPIVGMAATPTGQGYWFVAADGGIFAFGDARFFGSTGHIRLNQPIVGMAPTPTGAGYWFVAADGGIFSFGDARFFGSTGNLRLNQPIVGMAATPTGQGYWFVARDGGIFAFGDARFFGSTGHIRLNQPIVGMAPTPTGAGYWFVAADGGIFSFGDARFFGSTGNIRLNQPIAGMAPRPAT